MFINKWSCQRSGIIDQTDINTPTFNISKPTINETLNVNLISLIIAPSMLEVIRDIDNSAESPLWLREKLADQE